MFLSIYLSLYPSINQSINQSINPSINQPTNQPVYLSIYLSTNFAFFLSLFNLFIYPLIYISIYSFIHAFSSSIYLFSGPPSLKLYHVMSCFCMRNISCAMIWLDPTPDDARDASLLGPSRAPTQKADMGSRARARQRPQKEQPNMNSPQASPKTQMQQNTVNSSVLWPGSRAPAPEGPKTSRKNATTAQHASQPQQKPNGQNNSPTLSAAVLGGIYSLRHLLKNSASWVERLFGRKS